MPFVSPFILVVLYQPVHRFLPVVSLVCGLIKQYDEPPPRIGFNISPSEPYWVQVREAALQRAQELALGLIPINAEDYPQILSDEDQMALVEEVLGKDLDAIIGWEFPRASAYEIMQAGVPIIHMAETSFAYPLPALNSSSTLAGPKWWSTFSRPSTACCGSIPLNLSNGI